MHSLNLSDYHSTILCISLSLYTAKCSAFAPRIWGSKCLCNLLLFILFPGRRISLLPILALLTYCNSWCLVSFPSQINLISNSPFFLCCFWGRNIASLVLSQGLDMVPNFFTVNAGIFVPTFLIYQSQCFSLCFHNFFVCCILYQLTQVSSLVFIEEYYVSLSEFSHLLLIICHWIFSYY